MSKDLIKKLYYSPFNLTYHFPFEKILNNFSIIIIFEENNFKDVYEKLFFFPPYSLEMVFISIRQKDESDKKQADPMSC